MRSTSSRQPASNSLVAWLRSLSYAQRQEVQARTLADLAAGNVSDEQAADLLYTWEFWARDEQIEPAGDWTFWLVQAGRGYGKTRIGAEWVRASALSGRFGRVNLIGATADDARDIQIEGESGILAVCAPWERPVYFPTKRRLEWPNGCWSLIFTADEPERLRGKQHERLWADELAAWKYPEAWDQAMFGLRIGPEPRAVITSTPRPTRLFRELIADPNCIVTTGSTYENRENLAPAFYETIIRKHEGTRLGRQELLAELLEDVEGALWNRSQIDRLRVREAPASLQRIVVGVDPSGSSAESANAAGIVAAGIEPRGLHDVPHGYVLADRTVHGSPLKWARAAVDLYHGLRADRIVAEKNFGGEMVEVTIHAVDPNVPVTLVTASRGKQVRAEPIAALYEQGRVHHLPGLADLEDEQCIWTPDTTESPNRMDALVWALTELMLDKHEAEQESYRPSTTPSVLRRGDLTLVGDHYIDR